MSSKLFRPLALFVALVMILAPLNAKPTLAVLSPTTDEPATESIPVAPGTTKGVIGGVSDTGLYIVQLSDPPLAAYQGDIPSLSATSPEVTGARKLDVHTPESQAYLSYLEAQQSDFIAKMESTLGRSVEIKYQYMSALNGLAVRVSQQEAASLVALPGVMNVFADIVRELDTDTGPLWIGADDIWTGNIGSGLSTQGEGVVIGVIDTGINHAHPSFADVGGDGYDHTNPLGAGVYLGACNTIPGFCNDKLIGAYNFSTAPSVEDDHGHGSHTASTAAGNRHVVTVTEGVTTTIQGVAPHANLIAYRALNTTGNGYNSDLVAAVNQAIYDNIVDVLNYSISGSDDPWHDPVDLAFLSAVNAGIFVSASAGNSGPNPSTVAHTGPWNAAVAMSTIPRLYANSLDVTVPVTSTLQDLAALQGDGPALTADIVREITYSPTNILGCTAFPTGYFTNKIGLVQRGVCNFSVKVANVAAAGGTAMVLFNNRTGWPSSMAVGGTIPSVMIGLDDGLDLVDEIDANAPVTAQINAAISKIINPNLADLIDLGSSRGPSQHELLKPDYAAPGVNILAAVAASGGDPVRYAFYSGTSMAAPHSAGSAALLIALHPGWSPAEVKSALATTTFPWQQMRVTPASSIIPANPFDTGSGRLEVGVAANAGFVQNETYAHYVAANPAIGGDPKTLNQPSLVNYSCVGTCVWTRTLTSVLGFSATYTPVFTSTLPTMTVTVEPTSFTLPVSGTQVVTITADVTGLPVNEFVFGDVIFRTNATFPGGADVADQHMTFAISPVASNVPEHVTIDTDKKSGSQALTDLVVAEEITHLTTVVNGLNQAVVYKPMVAEDPTPSLPYNGDGGTYVTTVNVVTGTLRLVAQVKESTSLDVDMYVGRGSTPNAATVVCTRSTSAVLEYCTLDNPAAGTYWVLVQNWSGSAAPTDLIATAVGTVLPGDVDNLTVTGPTTVQPGVLFDLSMNWDIPTLVDGDVYYGVFTVGTDLANPDNLGRVAVDFYYSQPIFISKLGPETAQTGDVVPYSLVMEGAGPIDYAAWLTDTLPVGVEYAGGLTATFGTATYDDGTNSVYWSTNVSTLLAGESESKLQAPRPVALVVDSAPAEGSIVGVSMPAAPITMILDDGTVEGAIGWNSSTPPYYAYQFLWFNRFSPAPADFPFALNRINIYLTSNSYAVVGSTIDLVVYQDLDGNPANGAQLLSTIPVTVTAVPGLNSYDISANPVVFKGPGDVIIGAIDRWVVSGATLANYPAAQDTTASQHRSWIATWVAGDPPDPATLPADDLNNLIDDFGLGGNWIIRGYGDTIRPEVITVTFNVTVTAESGYITNTVNLKYGGDPFTADHLLHVGFPPEATFTSNTPVMLGEAAVFTPTVTGTSPFEYLWDFGDEITSTLETPSHVYAGAGAYTVTLTVTNPFGSDVVTHPFIVKAEVYLPLVRKVPTP
jgi:subtilisin family serine protease